MARIAGVDLPKEKRIETALTYIFGIGRSMATRVLSQASVNPDLRVKNLTDQHVKAIREVLSNLKVEGDLRKEVNVNIKRLMDINCYRGLRHRKGLPVRGQRTRTNARTRKGVKKTVGVQRKESVKKMGGAAPAVEAKK